MQGVTNTPRRPCSARTPSRWALTRLARAGDVRCPLLGVGVGIALAAQLTWLTPGRSVLVQSCQWSAALLGGLAWYSLVQRGPGWQRSLTLHCGLGMAFGGLGMLLGGWVDALIMPRATLSHCHDRLLGTQIMPYDDPFTFLTRSVTWMNGLMLLACAVSCEGVARLRLDLTCHRLSTFGHLWTASWMCLGMEWGSSAFGRFMAFLGDELGTHVAMLLGMTLGSAFALLTLLSSATWRRLRAP
jgi:hypothetical protein